MYTGPYKPQDRFHIIQGKVCLGAEDNTKYIQKVNVEQQKDHPVAQKVNSKELKCQVYQYSGVLTGGEKEEEGQYTEVNSCVSTQWYETLEQ